MHPLLFLHCQSLAGQMALTAAEVDAHLVLASRWQRAGDAIERSFSFADYHHTLAFVNAVAWVAHAEDHHPDLQVSYSRCTVRFSTHSVAGISVNDFICAAKVDALLTAAP